MNEQMNEPFWWELANVNSNSHLSLSISVTPGKPVPSWALSFPIYEVRAKEAGTAGIMVSWGRGRGQPALSP